MTLDREDQVLVLFDTATRPEYYQDVHKVLAAPRGALLSYEYRESKISAEAQDLVARGFAAVPKQVLIMYVQGRDYERGTGDLTKPISREDLCWQALRLGTLVSLVAHGEHWHFQFRVAGYPQSAHRFTTTVERLAETDQLPPGAWVSLLGKDSVTTEEVSPDAAAWQAIVDGVGSPPMQFAGDLFWRMTPPIRSRGPRKGRQLRTKETGGADTTATHTYIVPERSEFQIPVETHEAKGTPLNGALSEPKLVPEIPDSAPIFQIGAFPLRRNANRAIRMESRHSAKSERKVGEIQIVADGTSAWGASLVLDFEVRLARWKKMIGGVLLLLAAITGFTGGWWKTSGDPSDLTVLAMGIAAIVMVGIGSLLYRGILDFKT